MAKGAVSNLISDDINYLASFEADGVFAELCRVFCTVDEPKGSDSFTVQRCEKCVLMKYKFKGKQWIDISTSYTKANEVCALLFPITLKYGLVLLDHQNPQKPYSSADILNTKHICCELRIKAINKALREKLNLCVPPIFDIEDNYYLTRKIRGFVITLDKRNGAAIEQTKTLIALLKSLLTENEKLLCENRCFVIEAESYRLLYTFEAFGKRADGICFMDENDKPKIH
ncbi:MAG: hypothetical protein LBP62_00490 [Clostridiales bacterium]|nr:hypothetical protein [Clostridiales bacterium]